MRKSRQMKNCAKCGQVYIDSTGQEFCPTCRIKHYQPNYNRIPIRRTELVLERGKILSLNISRLTSETP